MWAEPSVGRRQRPKAGRRSSRYPSLVANTLEYPQPSTAAATNVMRANRKTDTKPEIRLRSELHRRGLRFRKNVAPAIEGRRIVVDIVFPRPRLAVFVDGCFWHSCPDHGTEPRSNSWYWAPKLRRNVQRDDNSTLRLRSAGWRVIRVWEHTPASEAAELVELALAVGNQFRRRRPQICDSQADATFRDGHLLGRIPPSSARAFGGKVNKVVAIDLFAGAGGLSLGARQAGVDVRVAVELDPMACSTLGSNAAHDNLTIVGADITTLPGHALRELAQVGDDDHLIVIGGPPCQPFSKAAYWLDPGDEAKFRQARARGELTARPVRAIAARPDPRRGLVGEVWRVAHEAGADAFVLENVPSLLHPRHRGDIDAVIEGAQAAGFVTTMIRANAAEFGVPQRRVRVFLLGVRDQAPVAPEPTHYIGEIEKPGRLPAVTAAQAISRFAGDEYAEDGEQVGGRWASHFESIPPGWNYKFHTAWADHPDPTFLTETRFWNFLLKLHPDLPAWTIAANPGPWTGPFHWDNRRLRTVELAALQGFPDDYVFVGGRRDRVRQIGNAVPPTLAAAMIKQVVRALEARRESVAA